MLTGAVGPGHGYAVQFFSRRIHIPEDAKEVCMDNLVLLFICRFKKIIRADSALLILSDK